MDLILLKKFVKTIKFIHYSLNLHTLNFRKIPNLKQNK